MARNIAWVVAVLLLAPHSSGAAGLGSLAACEKEQPPQRRGGQSTGDPKLDKDMPGSQRPERPKWWIDPKLRADLGITDQQSAAVEQIWQKSLPVLREDRHRLEELEDALSKLTDAADEAAVMAQSDRVESLRAQVNKGRTLMIYRMHRVLTADQRAKVKAMQDRREPPRHGPSPGK